MDKVYYKWNELSADIMDIVKAINRRKAVNSVYGVPRGGVAIAVAFSYTTGLPLMTAEGITEKTLILDDIIDSGTTRNRYPNNLFIALHRTVKSKVENDELTSWLHFADKWVVYPWETDRNETVEENVVRILQYIGEDPTREGLLETPHRVVRAYDEICAGYKQNPEDIIKTFSNSDNGNYEEIVLCKNVEIFSLCVVGSTFVDTPKGRIPISHIQDGEWVYCYNVGQRHFTLQQCKAPRITQRDANLVRVYTDKDTVICTPNHKFLTFDLEWVEAQNLTAGTQIIAMSRGGIGVHNIIRPYVQFSKQKRAVPEHRFVYETLYGPLAHTQHVHHIDNRPSNNDPKNLAALGKRAHLKYHANKDKYGARLRTYVNSLLPKEYEEFLQKQQQGQLNRSKEAKELETKRRQASLKKYWRDVKEGRIQRTSPGFNHKVFLVEHLDYTEDVWCMDVPVYHNFVANGMVVHNCEHHMLPFTGKAHIAYIPNKLIIGLSKLARIVDMFAKRLQTQERLCGQVTDVLMWHLKPHGAACVIECEHLCMRMRGVGKQNSTMVTSSLQGIFIEDSDRGRAARAELMNLIKE